MQLLVCCLGLIMQCFLMLFHFLCCLNLMVTNSAWYESWQFVSSKPFEINSLEIALVTFEFKMHVSVNLQSSIIHGQKSTITTFECILKLWGSFVNLHLNNRYRELLICTLLLQIFDLLILISQLFCPRLIKLGVLDLSSSMLEFKVLIVF